MNEAAIPQSSNSFYFAELASTGGPFFARPDIRWSRIDYLSIDQARRDEHLKYASQELARSTYSDWTSRETHVEPVLGPLLVYSVIVRNDKLLTDQTGTANALGIDRLKHISKSILQDPSRKIVHIQKEKPTREETDALRRTHECIQITNEDFRFNVGHISRRVRRQREGTVLRIFHRRLTTTESFWESGHEATAHYPLNYDSPADGYVQYILETTPSQDVYRSRLQRSVSVVASNDLPGDILFPLRASHETEVQDFARQIRNIVIERNRAKRQPKPS